MRILTVILLGGVLLYASSGHAQKAESDKTTQYIDGYGKPIVVDGAWLESICMYSQKEGDYFCDEKKLPAKKRMVSKKTPEPTNLSNPETEEDVGTETSMQPTWVPVGFEVKQKVLKEAFSRLPKPEAPDFNLKKPSKPELEKPEWGSGLIVGVIAGIGTGLIGAIITGNNTYRGSLNDGLLHIFAGVGFVLFYPLGLVGGSFCGLTREKVLRDDYEVAIKKYNYERQFYEEMTAHRKIKNARYHRLRQTIFGEAPNDAWR